MTNEWVADQAIVVPMGADVFRPYPHQTAAWDAMTRHYRSHREGMLVVPTGGGKTAIAARWLLRHRVSQGWRVLWLTHRRSLLRQAAESFFAAAGECQPKQHLHRIVISSTDMSWSNVSKSHDLVFSSIQSAVTEHNAGFVDLMAAQAPQGLFVVVDEAHHAASPSYQRLLKKLHELNCPVLGLSATPVRIQEDDQRRLWNIFRKIVYQVPKQALINQGILAAPTPETVQTKIEFEREFTDSDVQHLETQTGLANVHLRRSGCKDRATCFGDSVCDLEATGSGWLDWIGVVGGVRANEPEVDNSQTAREGRPEYCVVEDHKGDACKRRLDWSEVPVIDRADHCFSTQRQHGVESFGVLLLELPRSLSEQRQCFCR